MYYPNGQEKKVGMSDMVALEDGKVVDAVFRSPLRKYSGQSSSPRPVSEEAAIAKGGGKPSTKPMKMPRLPRKQHRRRLQKRPRRPFRQPSARRNR